MPALLAPFSAGALTTSTGLAVAGTAAIEVRRISDGALATIYSDEAGTAPITQPGFQTDANGHFLFYVAGTPRGYSITITKGADTWTAYVGIGTAGQYDYSAFQPALTTAGDIAVFDTAATRKAKGSAGDGLRVRNLNADKLAWSAIRFEPGGRLTLSAGVPVTNSDLTAQATVRFTPYVHNVMELYDATNTEWWSTVFAELSQALSDTTKSPAAAVANANYDMFAWNDAGTLRCTRGPLWKKAAAVTMTIATPAVVSWAAHGLIDGAPISFSTTGALPTGVVAGTTYFVKFIDANSFNIAATVGGANINTSGTQSGVHTGTAGNHLARDTGAGSTELEFFEGRYVNKNAVTNGPAARAGLFVGTIRTDTAGTAEDSAKRRFVWNMYNRRQRHCANPTETTDSWAYAGTAWRQANANAANQFAVVRGLDEDSVSAMVNAQGVSSGANTAARCGVGIDTSTAFSGLPGNMDASNALSVQGVALYDGMPGLGYHEIRWLEISPGAISITYYGDIGTPAHVQTGITGRTWA